MLRRVGVCCSVLEVYVNIWNHMRSPVYVLGHVEVCLLVRSGLLGCVGVSLSVLKCAEACCGVLECVGVC